MKFAINWLVTCIMLATNPCFAEVVLRFQAKVDSTAHNLGDILLIENDTHHWAKLSLQSQPTPDLWITKDQMIAWMTQQIGRFEYTWQGKTKIQVKQRIQSSGDELLNKAETALITQLTPKYSRIQITALSHPKASEYALDSFQIEIKNSYPTAKRVCVWLNRDKKHIPIWFKVQAYDHVLIAQNRLNANTGVKESDFALEERDIAGLTNQPVKLLIKNAWLTSSLGQGAILTTDKLTQAPLVMHGQTVQVSMHQNKITLIMEGIALSDGLLGQVIDIKNPSNQQTFKAQITGSGQAEVRA